MKLSFDAFEVYDNFKADESSSKSKTLRFFSLFPEKKVLARIWTIEVLKFLLLSWSLATCYSTDLAN